MSFLQISKQTIWGGTNQKSGAQGISLVAGWQVVGLSVMKDQRTKYENQA